MSKALRSLDAALTQAKATRADPLATEADYTKASRELRAAGEVFRAGGVADAITDEERHRIDVWTHTNGARWTMDGDAGPLVRKLLASEAALREELNQKAIDHGALAADMTRALFAAEKERDRLRAALREALDIADAATCLADTPQWDEGIARLRTELGDVAATEARALLDARKAGR